MSTKTEDFADIVALMELSAQLEAEQARIFEALPKLYDKLQKADHDLADSLNKRADMIAGELIKVSARLEAASLAHREDFERLQSELKTATRQQADYAKKLEVEVPAPIEQKIRSLFAEMPKPADGARGEPGKPGRDANLLTGFRGNWDNKVAYKGGETFTFRGSFYLVLADVRGVLPEVRSQTEKNPYYAVLAISGAPGLPGQGQAGGGGGGGSGLATKVSMPATTGASGADGQYAVSADTFAVYVTGTGWLFLQGYQIP